MKIQFEFSGILNFTNLLSLSLSSCPLEFSYTSSLVIYSLALKRMQNKSDGETLPLLAFLGFLTSEPFTRLSLCLSLSLSYSLTHLLTYSRTYSLSYSLSRSITHSLKHKLCHPKMYSHGKQTFVRI